MTRNWIVPTLACTLAGAACHTMRRTTLEDLTAHPAARVWVTRPDHSVLVMEGPQVFRGRLVGFVEGTYRELRPGDFQEIAARRLAAGRTFALIGASAVGVITAVVLASGTGDDFDHCVGSSVDCRELTP